MSFARSAGMISASVRSNTSGPLSSRLTTSDASRRRAARPDSSCRAGAINDTVVRMQHGAFGQIDDLAAVGAMQTDDDTVGRPTHREIHAPARGGQAFGDRCDRRRIEPGAAQFSGETVHFPGQIIGVVAMLRHATPAEAEMRTIGRAASGTRPATTCRFRQPTRRRAARPGGSARCPSGTVIGM